MDSNTLRELIYTMAERNDDVVNFLNSYVDNVNINLTKANDYTDRSFEGIIKMSNACEDYFTLRKTSLDYPLLSNVGINLLENLINYYEMDCTYDKVVKIIKQVSEACASDISHVSDNRKLRIDFEELIVNENLYEIMTYIYYCYFSEKLNEDY